MKVRARVHICRAASPGRRCFSSLNSFHHPVTSVCACVCVRVHIVWRCAIRTKSESCLLTERETHKYTYICVFVCVRASIRGRESQTDKQRAIILRVHTMWHCASSSMYDLSLLVFLVSSDSPSPLHLLPVCCLLNAALHPAGCTAIPA